MKPSTASETPDATNSQNAPASSPESTSQIATGTERSRPSEMRFGRFIAGRPALLSVSLPEECRAKTAASREQNVARHRRPGAQRRALLYRRHHLDPLSRGRAGEYRLAPRPH